MKTVWFLPRRLATWHLKMPDQHQRSSNWINISGVSEYILSPSIKLDDLDDLDDLDLDHLELDDLDITGFLHKELIFPKLPLFTPNNIWYGTNPGKENSERHLILSDTIIVTGLTICMRFRFLNCRILKNTTFLGMGCSSWEWGAMHFAHGSSDLDNLKLDIEGEGNHK